MVQKEWAGDGAPRLSELYKYAPKSDYTGGSGTYYGDKLNSEQNRFVSSAQNNPKEKEKHNALLNKSEFVAKYKNLLKNAIAISNSVFLEPEVEKSIAELGTMYEKKLEFIEQNQMPGQGDLKEIALFFESVAQAIRAAAFLSFDYALTRHIEDNASQYGQEAAQSEYILHKGEIIQVPPEVFLLLWERQAADLEIRKVEIAPNIFVDAARMDRLDVNKEFLGQYYSWKADFVYSYAKLELGAHGDEAIGALREAHRDFSSTQARDDADNFGFSRKKHEALLKLQYEVQNQRRIVQNAGKMHNIELFGLDTGIRVSENFLHEAKEWGKLTLIYAALMAEYAATKTANPATKVWYQAFGKGVFTYIAADEIAHGDKLSGGIMLAAILSGPIAASIKSNSIAAQAARQMLYATGFFSGAYMTSSMVQGIGQNFADFKQEGPTSEVVRRFLEYGAFAAVGIKSGSESGTQVKTGENKPGIKVSVRLDPNALAANVPKIDIVVEKAKVSELEADPGLRRGIVNGIIDSLPDKDPRNLTKYDFKNYPGLYKRYYKNSPYNALVDAGFAYSFEEATTHAKEGKFDFLGKKIYPWEMKRIYYTPELRFAAVRWLLAKTAFERGSGKIDPRNLGVKDFRVNGLSGLLDHYDGKAYKALVDAKMAYSETEIARMEAEGRFDLSGDKIYPWEIHGAHYNDVIAPLAVRWLMQKTGKEARDLSVDDFRSNGLGGLAWYCGDSVYLVLVKCGFAHGEKEVARMVSSGDFDHSGKKVYPWELAWHKYTESGSKAAVKWLLSRMAERGKTARMISIPDFLNAGIGSGLLAHYGYSPYRALVDAGAAYGVKEICRMAREKSWGHEKLYPWDMVNPPKNVKEIRDLAQMAETGRGTAAGAKEIDMKTFLRFPEIERLEKAVGKPVHDMDFTSGIGYDMPFLRPEAVSLQEIGMKVIRYAKKEYGKNLRLDDVKDYLSLIRGGDGKRPLTRIEAMDRIAGAGEGLREGKTSALRDAEGSFAKAKSLGKDWVAAERYLEHAIQLIEESGEASVRGSRAEEVYLSVVRRLADSMIEREGHGMALSWVDEKIGWARKNAPGLEEGLFDIRIDMVEKADRDGDAALIETAHREMGLRAPGGDGGIQADTPDFALRTKIPDAQEVGGLYIKTVRPDYPSPPGWEKWEAQRLMKPIAGDEANANVYMYQLPFDVKQVADALRGVEGAAEKGLDGMANKLIELSNEVVKADAMLWDIHNQLVAGEIKVGYDGSGNATNSPDIGPMLSRADGLSAAILERMAKLDEALTFTLNEAERHPEGAGWAKLAELIRNQRDEEGSHKENYIAHVKIAPRICSLVCGKGAPEVAYKIGDVLRAVSAANQRRFSKQVVVEYAGPDPHGSFVESDANLARYGLELIIENLQKKSIKTTRIVLEDRGEEIALRLTNDNSEWAGMFEKRYGAYLHSDQPFEPGKGSGDFEKLDCGVLLLKRGAGAEISVNSQGKHSPEWELEIVFKKAR